MNYPDTLASDPRVSVHKPFSQLLMLLIAAGLCAFLALSVQAAEDSAARFAAMDDEALVASAEDAVDAYISDFITDLQDIKPLFESDRSAYFDAIEASLEEFVDFREVARGVMAKYSTGPDGASDAQLDRFADVFKASLIDFYGSAMAGYGGVEYAILEQDREPSDPARATNVRMNIEADDGSLFEVQFTMYLNDDYKWLMRNLYVEGVNLRRQYHAQFDSLMMSNEYDIDTVIDVWEVEE